LIVHPGFRHNGSQITMAATGNIMKPLVLFSGLAIACAVGLLALSYQGWRDDPSVVVASLEQGGAAVPAKTETAVQQSAASYSAGSQHEQQTAAVAPDAGSAGETQSAPEPAQSATELKPALPPHRQPSISFV
jgi:hypothetical protein